MQVTVRSNILPLKYMPQLFCAASILFSIFIQLNTAFAAISSETRQYATSFFSLTDPDRVIQVNQELSRILQNYPQIKVVNITSIPVTSKGKKYFRSVVVTLRKGMYELKKREEEIGRLLSDKALGKYGLAIYVKRWSYQIKKPILSKLKTIPLKKYDKTDIAGAGDNKKCFVVLINKFASLYEADRFCRKLGLKGIEVMLGYPRKITGGRDGRKIDDVPFRIFLKKFEGKALLFENARKAQGYVKKKKIELQRKIGKGLWTICDTSYTWQLIPKKKYNLLLGSFRLDQLSSKKEKLKPYLDALEERGVPFYLATVQVKKRTYLRVVHDVPDESQVQIDMTLGELAEELNDFSVELGLDFNINPQKIPKDDPLEGTKFTLDDLLMSISNGGIIFHEGENIGLGEDKTYGKIRKDRPFSLASKAKGLPVNVRDLFRELFLPRISPLQNDLKGKNMIGLKVIKIYLPGKGRYTCFAIEKNYQKEHSPLAEKLKATGKILAFFVYRQDEDADLDRLAQLAAINEIRRRQAEADDIARLEQKQASQRLALDAAEEMCRRQKFMDIKYIFEKFGYNKLLHPVVLYKYTRENFSVINETVNSINIADYPDLLPSIKALMWTESSGNPRARSFKNARGPLQVTLKGYLHTRRKFAELIRMAERSEMLEKNGDSLKAQDVFPLPSRRLLENAWRLVDPSTGYNDAARDPELNICEGTLQFLIDYTFFSQRYMQKKPKGKRPLYYPYQLKRKEKDYYPDEKNILDPEIAAMASYNYGRYGVIKAIKRKGKDFVRMLPRQTRQHLANYFITKLSLDEKILAEYKKYTNHDITIKFPREPYRFRGKIRKIAQR